MRSINLDYYLMGGGKRAFRQLPKLLNRGVFYTDEYKNYEQFLVKEAKNLNCEITDLEIKDDDVDYESIKW